MSKLKHQVVIEQRGWVAVYIDIDPDDYGGNVPMLIQPVACLNVIPNSDGFYQPTRTFIHELGSELGAYFDIDRMISLQEIIDNVLHYNEVP